MKWLLLELVLGLQIYKVSDDFDRKPGLLLLG